MSSTARDWSVELTAYIDGELSAEDTTALEAALAADPQLKALEAQLRRTVTLVEAMEAPATSQALRRGVLNAVDTPTLGEKLAAWLTPARLVPAGAFAAAVLAVVVVVGRNEGTPKDEEQLFLAQNMDVLEDLDVVGLDSPEDLDVVASLKELEVQR